MFLPEHAHHEQHFPVEAVVGGVLGTIAVIASIAAGLYYYKMIKRQSKIHHDEKAGSRQSIASEKGTFDRSQGTT